MKFGEDPLFSDSSRIYLSFCDKESWISQKDEQYQDHDTDETNTAITKSKKS